MSCFALLNQRVQIVIIRLPTDRALHPLWSPLCSIIIASRSKCKPCSFMKDFPHVGSSAVLLTGSNSALVHMKASLQGFDLLPQSDILVHERVVISFKPSRLLADLSVKFIPCVMRCENRDKREGHVVRKLRKNGVSSLQRVRNQGDTSASQN